MLLLRNKFFTQGEKRETSTKTCNETMLPDKYKDCKKKHAVNVAIIFIYSTPANYQSVLFFSIIGRLVLMALVFYFKEMLEKITMQRTQQFSAFPCDRKKPVKCSACAVARKIETDCFFRRHLPIYDDLKKFGKKKKTPETT